MKRYLTLLLCCCIISSMGVTALASGDSLYDETISARDEYIARFGGPPSINDYPDGNFYLAAYAAWEASVNDYARQRAYYFDAMAAQKAQEEEAAQKTAEEAASKAQEEIVPPAKTTEVGGVTRADSASVSLFSGSSDKYPVGSLVDAAGNVFSASGELLSPGTTPAVEPIASVSLSNAVPASSDAFETAPAETSQPVYYVIDLRPGDSAAVTPLAGLKALTVSIFGEYTPVMTTSVITETVGDETTQYLVETVAPGAAGVDYEWIAGVFLFGILLFCLMKLLGGILS